MKKTIYTLSLITAIFLTGCEIKLLKEENLEIKLCNIVEPEIEKYKSNQPSFDNLIDQLNIA